MFELGLSKTEPPSTTATIQKGAFRARGELWLDEDMLHFSPFEENADYGPYEIPCADITSVSKAWSRGVGVIPAKPNAIRVAVEDGKDFQFILTSPQKWLDIIRESATSV